MIFRTFLNYLQKVFKFEQQKPKTKIQKLNNAACALSIENTLNYTFYKKTQNITNKIVKKNNNKNSNRSQ
jgi:hypothetical protein